MDHGARELIATHAPRARRVLAYAIASTWTVGMLVLFWSPPPPQPKWSGEWLDVTIHATAFFGFAIVWWIAGLSPRRLAAFGAVLAITTELVQPLLPWPRSMEIGDVLADAGGLAVAVFGLARLRRRGRAVKTSAWRS